MDVLHLALLFGATIFASLLVGTLMRATRQFHNPDGSRRVTFAEQWPFWRLVGLSALWLAVTSFILWFGFR